MTTLIDIYKNIIFESKIKNNNMRIGGITIIKFVNDAMSSPAYRGSIENNEEYEPKDLAKMAYDSFRIDFLPREKQIKALLNKDSGILDTTFSSTENENDKFDYWCELLQDKDLKKEKPVTYIKHYRDLINYLRDAKDMISNGLTLDDGKEILNDAK